MRAIRSRDTKPEMVVRRAAHRLGYRYRLSKRDVPGKPDMVFAKRRAVVFVHGCFWHQHNCGSVRVPKSNVDYWAPKLARTTERDAAAVSKLKEQGWRVLTIWECEIENPVFPLSKVLSEFLRN